MKLKSNITKKIKEVIPFVPIVYKWKDFYVEGEDIEMAKSNFRSANDPWLQEFHWKDEQAGLSDSVSYGLGMPHEEEDYYGGDSLRKRLNQW